MALITNLISYYKCDEANGNLIDETANYHLAQYGAVPSQSGILNSSRGVYSNTNYFKTTSYSSMNADKNLSISFWIKRTNTFSNYELLIEIGSTNNDFRLEIYGANDNKIHYYISKYAVTAYGNIVTGVIPLNTWTHITATLSDTGTMKLYVDGVKVSEVDNSFAAMTATTYLWIGKASNSTASGAVSYLDEIGFWEKTLSLTEIEELYNSGNGLAYPFTTSIPLQVNIGDAWKDVTAMQINIGDAWKDVAGMQINIGDSWKTIF